MRILYLSCHAVLEFDEIKLLHELGHQVFSPGAYVEPANPGDASLRPAIPGLIYDQDILRQFHEIGGKHPGEDAKNHLTKEFVDNFDAVLVMHIPRWVSLNWDAMKHKRVIWRTIGQSISNTEAELAPYRAQGMQIVRYSPKEKNIPGYIGEDAMIRFYKDPDEYGPWSGWNNRVISFAQSMRQRGPACNFELFDKATAPFPRHLYGPGNEGLSWSTGRVSFEQLRAEMKSNRAYFYTGTHPASYTLNFIESWMTGIPIVAIGPQHGNANYFAGHDLYEVHELINSHDNGFVSDDVRDLQLYIKMLLENEDLASEVGRRGRESAIHHFGKATIMQKWRDFLR